MLIFLVLEQIATTQSVRGLGEPKSKSFEKYIPLNIPILWSIVTCRCSLYYTEMLYFLNLAVTTTKPIGRYMIENFWNYITESTHRSRRSTQSKKKRNHCHAMIRYQNADAMVLASALMRGTPRPPGRPAF
jgi:hypothetical protein